jgi:hypothetical protein
LTFAPKKGKIIKVFSLLGRSQKFAAKFPSKRERARARRDGGNVGVGVERVGDLLTI